MEQVKHTVVAKTNEYPVGLKTAQEVAELLKGAISEKRLIELADTGFIPHFRIDNGVPLFEMKSAKKWLANNLLQKHEGISFPPILRVGFDASKNTDRPPVSIWNIPNLRQLPICPPGVYFLCKGEEVVYIGQSISPSSRIEAHLLDKGKDFDRAYYLPCPIDELDNLEGALIQVLAPSQNGRHKDGRIQTPHMSDTTENILESFGLTGFKQELISAGLSI